VCIAHILVFFFRSDAVGIKYEKERGRYAVAARDIAVGELIAVETAFVALLDKANVMMKIHYKVTKMGLKACYIYNMYENQNIFFFI
jgi:hypothetical protein